MFTVLIHFCELQNMIRIILIQYKLSNILTSFKTSL